MTPLEPHLREVTDDDLPGLAALERSAFGPDAWSAEAIEAELSGDGRTTLLAEDPEGVVGYAVTRAAGDVVDLHRVVVADRARRRGVAARLVRALASRAAGDRMLLEVSADNEAAIALYRRLGFEPIDRRRAYYRDGSDALVMQRDLEPREDSR
jgi:ribosomal-protein-alanine N-acetyltransferase